MMVEVNLSSIGVHAAGGAVKMEGVPDGVGIPWQLQHFSSLTNCLTRLTTP